MIEVLFVCLGNICRSPTAHGVFQHRVDQAGLGEQIRVDSAGTGDWHVGRPPDDRAHAAALGRGYDLSALRARQVSPIDFDRFDYVLAMDTVNLADLEAMRPPRYQGELRLFLDYAQHGSPESVAANAAQRAVLEVPDPYYGAADGFDRVLDLVEAASDGLLAEICRRHQLTPG